MNREEHEKTLSWFRGFQAGCNNAVMLLDKITEESISEAREEMIKIEKESRSSKSKKPILLLISTNGGNVDQSYHLKDFMDGLSRPVDGLVIDNASSMGVDILQMCRRRYMLPNAKLFCHFTRVKLDLVLRSHHFPENELRMIAQSLESDHRRRVALYREKTGMSAKQVLSLFKEGEDFDIFIAPERAKKLGLIDKIERGFKFFP
jgi:ATP-dependent protease ClpP protease subunit